MLFLFLISSINFLSSLVNGSLLFSNRIIKSDLFIIFKLFSTPIFSTILSVFLIPAVSTIFKIIPFRVIDPSTISLVVPSISVTMAFSSSNREFNRLLLPTFGLPIIPIFIPKVNILLSLDLFIISISFCLNSFILGYISLLVNYSISSYSG